MSKRHYFQQFIKKEAFFFSELFWKMERFAQTVETKLFQQIYRDKIMSSDDVDIEKKKKTE